MHGNARNISANQERALALLVEGKKIIEVASDLGINESTVRRWLYNQDFQQAYRDARKQQLDHAFAALQGKFGDAIAVLNTNLGAEQPRDQLKAAEIIIDKSIKTARLTERIAELEAENETLRAEQSQAGLLIFDINELTTEEREQLRAINEAIAQRTP